MLPSNKLKHPIEELIAKLQALPKGTTYEEEDVCPTMSGETPYETLGSTYNLNITIVEGFNPPRLTLEEWRRETNSYIRPYDHTTGQISVGFPDTNHPLREALWHLVDYTVSNVSAGVIWLVPKPTSLAHWPPKPTTRQTPPKELT